MSYMRHAGLLWTSLAANLLIVAAFQVFWTATWRCAARSLTSASFFTIDGQGNDNDVRKPVLGLGHPEVDIMVCLRSVSFRGCLGRSPASRCRYRPGCRDEGRFECCSFCWLHQILQTWEQGEREKGFLRGHDNDHLAGTDGRQSLQLAVHDCTAGRIGHGPDPVVDRLFMVTGRAYGG